MICNSQHKFHLAVLIEELASLDQLTWGDYLLSRDPLYNRMSDQEKHDIIHQSLDCADRQVKKWKYDWRNSVLNDIIGAEGITIVTNESPVMKEFSYFAIFDGSSLSIELSREAIYRVEQVIQNNDLMPILDHVSIQQLILAHEFYHYIESKMNIYTTQSYIETKSLGVFPKRRRVRRSSEVAAVHFSKQWLGLSYCPALFDILLIHTIDADRALRLSRELLRKGGKK